MLKKNVDNIYNLNLFDARKRIHDMIDSIQRLSAATFEVLMHLNSKHVNLDSSRRYDG